MACNHEFGGGTVLTRRRRRRECPIFFCLFFLPRTVSIDDRSKIFRKAWKYRSISSLDHHQKLKFLKVVSPLVHTHTTLLVARVTNNQSSARAESIFCGRLFVRIQIHTHSRARVFSRRFLKSDDDDDDDARASRIRVGRQSAFSRGREWKKKNRARDERETKRGKCEYLFSRSSFEDDESERATTTVAKRMHGNCVR